MTEGGIYQAPRPRATSIAIVVLIHGAALTALAMSKMEVFTTRTPPIIVRLIKRPPVPPPVSAEKAEAKQPAEITFQKPIVQPPIEKSFDGPVESFFPDHIDDFRSTGGAGPTVDPVPPPPVRKEARIDSRSALQPPYPPSEQRAGAEGIVSLRVLIGPDGRVKAAEKVRATSDAFYQAALRHALRSWRFTPATVDGRPVESRKLMTVRFELHS